MTDFLKISRCKFFTSDVFSNMCKKTKIVAKTILKNESKLDCNNFRPISLLSNIRKIIYKTIHIRLIKFLYGNNCFHDFQFGFRLKFSTNTALMSIIESVLPISYKYNLAFTLLHRFFMICSSYRTLHFEILELKQIFRSSEYLKNLLIFALKCI